ncbi:MAG: PNGase F N-terminal domain-containing protein [Breznakibacter sp.]
MRYFMYVVSCFLLLSVFPAKTFAAKGKEKPYGKVTYRFLYNGQESDRTPLLFLEYSNGITKLWQNDPAVKSLIPGYAREATYIDYQAAMVYRVCDFGNQELYHSSMAFDRLNKVELVDGTREILGYNCKKATTVINSNRIDIWYSEEAGLKGSPNINSGMVPGLVLSIVRNGNSETVASKIEYAKKAKDLKAANLGTGVDAFELDGLKRTKTVIATNVFTNEQICWGNTNSQVKSPVLDSIYHFAGGTLIVKKVKLPELPDHYSIFAELSQYSNGDAYDRTGSVFVIPQEKTQSFWDGLINGMNTLPVYYDKDSVDYQGVVSTPSYQAPVELVRFFTPFGIRHFNDRVRIKNLEWEDSTIYKQDVSDLRHYLKGEVLVGAFIGNYDKGGHKLSLDFKAYPGSYEWENSSESPFVMPLFNTCNVMEMGGQRYGTMFKNDSLTVSFEIPEGVKNLKLRYITTGHGGWGGGDEFNQKLNEIFIDGQRVFAFIPWRTDCGAYRKYNPVSGNFWNGLSSSDLSRSGWCPGTATQPEYIELKDLKPGKHTMKVAIPLGKTEGSSFSSWCVSGVIVGERE